MYCRSFLDISKTWQADEIDFYTDASKNPLLGFGRKCENEWMYQNWDSNFLVKNDPSIEFLELYAVTVGVFLWIEKFQNKKIMLFCDNKAVVAMINNTSSKCQKCTKLLRMIVLKGMMYNVKISAKYVTLKDNDFADSLSRLQLNRFFKLVKTKQVRINELPCLIPEEIWPLEKVWNF